MDAITGEDDIQERIRDSRKSLCEDLSIHIFCPYDGLANRIFEEVTYNLRKESYDAYICLELDYTDLPPDVPRNEMNWRLSRDCLERADVAIFVFLEANEERVVHPNTDLTDYNSSVVAELFHWLNNMEKPKERTFVMYEGSIEEDIGSLIPGVIDTTGLETGHFDSEDYVELYTYIESHCWTWVNRFS